MSFAQAIRGEFLFFQGSVQGGTQPTSPIYTTDAARLIACSSIVACAALVRKTIEFRGKIADFAAFPVIVEGTISENANGNGAGANPQTAWFPLTGNIVAPGLVAVLLGAVEPELTNIRIRALVQNGQGIFPASISATLAAVYDGQCWDRRIKGGLGYPQHNSDYRAV